MEKVNVCAALFTLFITSGAFAQQIPIPGDQHHLYGPNSTWSSYLQVGGNGRVTANASVTATNGNLHLDSKEGFALYLNYYSLGNTLINPNNGLVGIGTQFPAEKLDVVGNLRADRFKAGNALLQPNSRSSFNSFNAGGTPILNPGWIALDLGGADNSSDRIVMGTGYGGKGIIGTHNYNLTAWGGDLLISPKGGRVGIGTTTPNAVLAVNGDIRAKEVKVESANWPDYVFGEDYELPDIRALASYIKSHKHLPGVPTAAEVEAEGIDLGEMNRILLEKLEELTLYLIEEREARNDMEGQIKALTEKIGLLGNIDGGSVTEP